MAEDETKKPADTQAATPPDAKPADPATPATTEVANAPLAEPLSDGTTPTIISKTATPDHSVPKGKPGSLGSVYRRADIMTTLFTFLGAALVVGLAIGGYLYYVAHKAKTVAPKVNTLDSSDLSKLSTFLNGDSAGTSSQVLTINPTTLLNGRVAIAKDLKVEGATEVDGATTLGDLTVNKTSTLGVTSIRGQLTVSGPLVLQSPATMSAGATVTGNLAVSGNGSFGGSISAGVVNTASLSVTGNLNVNGHIVITGASTTVTPNDGAGPGASAIVDGNDSDGTITIRTGNITNTFDPGGALLVQLNFHTAYGKVPRVIISPIGSPAGGLKFYTQKTNSMFIIGTASAPTANTSYSFDYWVVQ